jgi:hypothetical protein
MTSDAIPLADARAFARPAARTRLIRLTLAAGALAAAVAAFLLALRNPPESALLLPAGSDGIVALDLSASVSTSRSRRLASTLDRLARSKGRLGLVIFSDTAYLALPPRSPAAELRPFTRFFRVTPQGAGARPTTPKSPWSSQFSAGTLISEGLALALDVAREDGGGRTAVLLVSDLDASSGDVGRITTVILEYRRAGVPLHVVALDPEPRDRATFAALLARPGALTVAPDPVASAIPESRVRDHRLIAATLLTGVLLAGLIVVTARLRWRDGP